MTEFTVTRDFKVIGRRQGVMVVREGFLGFGRDVREATIFTIEAPSGEVEVARADRAPFGFARHAVYPSKTKPASKVDCLLVQLEYGRLARELFLDPASADLIDTPVESILDGLTSEAT